MANKKPQAVVKREPGRVFVPLVEKKDYHRFERSYGSFTRSFHLPKEVQIEKVAAKFKDGALEIKIPKTEEAKKKEKKVLIE